MKNILMMSAILYVSIGYSQNIVLEHTLEGRDEVYPIGDIDGDGVPELQAKIHQTHPTPDLMEIYDGETLELKWTLPSSHQVDLFTAAIKYILPPLFDFNGDGKLDILTIVKNENDNTTGFTVYDLINNTTIYEHNISETSDQTDGSVNLADINGDTKVEILLEIQTNDGSERNTYIFSTDVSLGTNQRKFLPDNYKLSQNYPNPFNPTTTIQYEMPQNGNVNVSIYNIKGELVEKLVDEYKNIGMYSIQWNPKNISSGQYFYQISVDGFVQTKKMVLLK
jgi:hypothetical protein